MSKRHLVSLLSLGLFVGAATIATGQTVRDWAVVPSVTNGNPTPAVTYFDGSFTSRTYFAIDKTLYGKVSSSGASVGTPVTAGAAIENFPSVVPLADGKRYIFVGSQDGYLYKINAATMAVDQMRDMRRPACASDAIQATPTVQLAAYSNGFTPAKDLVYVPTYHGCGDTTLNQVIALDASDIRITNLNAVVWTFNAGEYEMDYIAEGCSLDYDRNQLYCGSALSSGAYQNSVWAISTLDGGLVWAGNYNSVVTRPQLGRGANNHLYVADYLGSLHAIDVVRGTEDWLLPITSYGSGAVTTYIANNLWAEFRAPYGDMIFVTDSAGVLHAVYDSGAVADGGIEAWTSSFAGGQKVLSLGSVSPTLGKLYVGLDDGTVHQLDLSTGTDEAYRTISASPKSGDVVTDPTLHLGGGTEISKLVASANSATAGTITKQFSVPWTNASTGASLQNCTADSECSSLTTPANCNPASSTNRCCTLGACNLATGTCYSVPQAADNPATTSVVESCNDGNGTCTTSKQCVAGSCIGTWSYTACPANSARCGTDPLRACGAGKVCVSSAAGGNTCIDPKTNADYCGGAARSCNASSSRQNVTAWGGDRACNKGICERDIAGACTAPPAATIQGKAAGATHLNFVRSGGVCTARLTNSATTGNNRVRDVAVSGMTTDYPVENDRTTHGVAILTTPQVTRTWVSIDQDSTYDPSPGLIDSDGMVHMLDQWGPIALPTACTGDCPFTSTHFNQGLSSPAVNASGQPFFGNYRANGDLWYFVLSRPYTPTPAYDNSDTIFGFEKAPPWCPARTKLGGGGCTQQDRISSLDFGPDGILRIGHKAEVVFYDPVAQSIVRRVPLDSGWYGAGTGTGQFTFSWVVSVTADTLNRSNQTFVEVRDSNDKQHVLVINPDYSVRFHSSMQSDLWGATWPPRLMTPDTAIGPTASNDGRMSAQAQGNLFRLTPSATSKNGATAAVRRLAMPR